MEQESHAPVAMSSMLRQKRLHFGVALVFIILLWPWLYILTCTAYTYLYWVYPALQIANVADIGSGEALPVPKLIHQTWKNSEIPEKWQKAHDSCIKLHPDYEYRLWTDSDGLKFVKVRSLLLSVQPEM